MRPRWARRCRQALTAMAGFEGQSRTLAGARTGWNWRVLAGTLRAAAADPAVLPGGTRRAGTERWRRWPRCWPGGCTCKCRPTSLAAEAMAVAGRPTDVPPPRRRPSCRPTGRWARPSRMLVAHLTEVILHEAPRAGPTESEPVHQMRVALRRLRSAVGAVRPRGALPGTGRLQGRAAGAGPRSARRATGTCSSPAPAARWRRLRRGPRRARACWTPPNGAGWKPMRRCSRIWRAPPSAAWASRWRCWRRRRPWEAVLPATPLADERRGGGPPGRTAGRAARRISRPGRWSAGCGRCANAGRRHRGAAGRRRCTGCACTASGCAMPASSSPRCSPAAARGGSSGG